MASNPNDIARILNEMAKTLQELSQTQLDSVKSIVDEKVKQNQHLETIKRKEKELTKKYAVDSQILLEEKKKKNKLVLLSINSTKKLISETKKSLDNKRRSLTKIDTYISKFGLEKEYKFFQSAKKLLSTKKEKPLLINSPAVQKQSSEDFTKKEDIQLLQLEMLKSIDSKISNLGSQSSGGLFDFLFGMIPKLFSGFLSGGGALAGGAIGLGKYGKLFKIPNIIKGGASLLGKLKNPKVAIPVLLGSVVAAGGASAFNMLSSDNGIEGRQKGGRVGSGSAYVVGEDGPEIFVPKDNGTIIPNNKLSSSSGFSADIRLKQYIKDMTKDFTKKIGKVWSGLFTPFKKSFSTFATNMNKGIVSWKDYLVELISTTFSKIKSFITNFVPSLLGRGADKVQTVFNDVKNFISPPKEEKPITYPTTSSLMPKLPNSSGKTNTSLEPKAIGDYNIGKTKMYKLHQNEMVIPKQQSELLRAVAELSNDFKINRPVETNTTGLDKDFWVNRFLPEFQKAIKTNKIQNKPIANKIASVF